MDVQIGKRKFVIEQTWGEYKEFTKADNALDVEAATAREIKDAAALSALDDRRMDLHEGQLIKCLKMIDGQQSNGDLGALQYNEVAGLAMRLLNPTMELMNRLPFEGQGQPSQV